MRSLLLSTVCAIVILFSFFPTNACTTGLAGTRATNNDHTLLWKNRDSGHTDNEIFFFNQNNCNFIGLINVDDTTQVWAGVNNYGFAIMNAESRDMAIPGEETKYDDEGYLMKTALSVCKTVDDFELLMKKSNVSGRKVTSNFGVIDSTGAAVFFETGNHEYIRCDADGTAKDFLIRANFAYNARSTEGYGRVRHDRALRLFDTAVQTETLDHRYIISSVSTDIALPDSLIDPQKPGLRKTQDTVNRYRSVAAAVFDGYNDPRLTTFWVTLGEPVCSVSIPLWVMAGEVPAVLNADGGSPLNTVFQDIKGCLYIDKNHLELDKLAQVQTILNRGQRKIFRSTERQLRRWGRAAPSAADVARFQEKLAGLAMKTAEQALDKLQSGTD